MVLIKQGLQAANSGSQFRQRWQCLHRDGNDNSATTVFSKYSHKDPKGLKSLNFHISLTQKVNFLGLFHRQKQPENRGPKQLDNLSKVTWPITRAEISIQAAQVQGNCSRCSCPQSILKMTGIQVLVQYTYWVYHTVNNSRYGYPMPYSGLREHLQSQVQIHILFN